MAYAETDEQALYAEGSLRLLCARRLGACKLFDLEKDPGETTNLARDSRFAVELKRNRELLRAWCRRYNDAFPVV